MINEHPRPTPRQTKSHPMRSANCRDRAGGAGMITIEGTQEMYDRWQAHFKYVSSLTGAISKKKVSPEKAKAVIELYNECGSKRKVSLDMHIAPLTVTKILDARGVPA